MFSPFHANRKTPAWPQFCWHPHPHPHILLYNVCTVHTYICIYWYAHIDMHTVRMGDLTISCGCGRKQWFGFTKFNWTTSDSVCSIAFATSTNWNRNHCMVPSISCLPVHKCRLVTRIETLKNKGKYCVYAWISCHDFSVYDRRRN